MRARVPFKLTTVLFLAACASMGDGPVPNPSNAKLADAIQKYSALDQPQAAEALLRDLLKSYAEERNPHGMGHAHRAYGDFLNSLAVAKAEQAYRRDGFQDRSITFDNRIVKAKEHYAEALRYYELAERREKHAAQYDALTNLYINMAWSARMLGESRVACTYYRQAHSAYQENMRRTPEARPMSPTGTIPESIKQAEKEAGCAEDA